MNEIILEFLFGTGEYTQAIPLPLAFGLASTAASFLPKIFGGGAAKRARRSAEAQQRRISNLRANRQKIINPYSGVSDLSSMINNPFANLQVATQAAEMQAEQTDIGLASTLDVLRATGRSAGGATALAREAARSKQGIAASIEQQEAVNARLRAQGEQVATQQRMAEAQRMQQADVFGKTFMFQAQEQRDVADLSRASALQQQYLQQETDIRGAQTAAQGQILGSAFSAMPGMMG